MNVKKINPEWWDSACKELSSNDEVMQVLISQYSDNKLSSICNPFYSLSKSIVGQQISVVAASAIWKRLEKKYDILGGCFFQRDDLKDLRNIGLSERKAIYLINLSKNLKDLNAYTYWKNLNDKEVFSNLIKFKGIGPWSIKMFQIFCLNRPDIFSSDDLGLIKAIGKNYFNGKKIEKNKAENFALKWKPWRTAASWFLWRSIDPEIVLY